MDLWPSGHHHAFYPGYHQHIAYIGQSCLGGGARPLIGDHKRSPRSFTLLDFDADPISVSAFKGPSFETRLNIQSLPAEPGTRQATLKRLDLAPQGARRVVPASQ